MTGILIFGSIAFLVMQTISLRFIKVKTLRENILINAAFSGLVALALFVYALFVPMSFSPATILFGIVFGAVFIATVSCYYYAMQCGPLSYTTFFFSASMLIPAVAGIFFFKEPPKVTTIVGIVLFLAAFYFISVLGSRQNGKFNVKWLLLSFATWVLNGSLAVISKTQQTVLAGKEVFSMMLVCFFSAFLFAALFYLVLLLKGKEKPIRSDFSTMGRSALCLVGAAVGTGGGNIILTYLSSRIQGAYLFPLVQGCIMVTITLFSLLFLKEKLNKFGTLGILLGIAAIVTINL